MLLQKSLWTSLSVLIALFVFLLPVMTKKIEILTSEQLLFIETVFVHIFEFQQLNLKLSFSC